ncbi:MAG: hypothetical protein U0670_16715 [Anaerolineae bacterium]
MNDERRIFIITVVGRWHWHDIEPVIAEVQKIGTSHENPFDLIVDGRQSTLYEPNLVDFLRNRVKSRVPRSARRLLILVGLDDFTKVLWRGVTQMPFAHHLQAHFFDTVDEAVHFAQQYTEVTNPQGTGEAKDDA